MNCPKKKIQTVKRLLGLHWLAD